MSKICSITGKKVLFGKNVSHAHNKTNRRFDINIHSKCFYSNVLKRKIKLFVSNHGMRTVICKYGSIDEFLSNVKPNNATKQIKSLLKLYKSAL